MAIIHEPCVFLKPEMMKIAKTARIDAFCKIEGGQGVMLGEFVHIASFSHLNVGGGKLVFEDHSGCSSHCVIGSATPDWSYLYISAAEPSEHCHVIRYLTRICSFSMLGMNVTVLPGRTVGEGAIVKPGSVVVDDVKSWTIVEGNPAVKVGTRTIKHGSLHATNGTLK
jgi:galactoside O-acetyltransferase